MTIRGIRGAITIDNNTSEDILSATRELLRAIIAANPGLLPEDIASAFFTTTADVTAAFPAKAARQIGWDNVPLMCASEIVVPNSLPNCIRVLIHWNTRIGQKDIRHIYLGDAATLRPDIVNHESINETKGEIV